MKCYLKNTMQMLSDFLGEFLAHTFIHCNHIPGRVELVAYQLDNHKSRHVQYTFHFVKGPVHVCEQDNCKYNRFFSSSMLTKVYLSNERGIPFKSSKLN